MDVDILVYIEKTQFLTKRVHCKFIWLPQLFLGWASCVLLAIALSVLKDETEQIEWNRMTSLGSVF